MDYNDSDNIACSPLLSMCSLNISYEMLLARKLCGLWELMMSYKEIKLSLLSIYWNITYLFILFMSLHRTDQVYESQ